MPIHLTIELEDEAGFCLASEQTSSWQSARTLLGRMKNRFGELEFETVRLTASDPHGVCLHWDSSESWSGSLRILADFRAEFELADQSRPRRQTAGRRRPRPQPVSC